MPIKLKDLLNEGPHSIPKNKIAQVEDLQLEVLRKLKNMTIPSGWKVTSLPDDEPENVGVNATVFYNYVGPTDGYDLKQYPMFARFDLFYDDTRYTYISAVLVEVTADDYPNRGAEYRDLGTDKSFDFNPSGNNDKDSDIIVSKIRIILGNLAKDIKTYDPSELY